MSAWIAHKPEAAAPLSPELSQDLEVQLGMPTTFKAGKLFDQPQVWRRTAGPIPKWTEQWFKFGYSELLTGEIPRRHRPNNDTCFEANNESYVTGEIAKIA